MTPQQVKEMIEGRGVPRLDGRDKITGAAKYSTDQRPRGLLYARALWCPFAQAAEMKQANVDAAQSVPGVKAVRVLGERHITGKLALVVGQTPEAADAGLAALQMQLKGTPIPVDIETAVKEASSHNRFTRKDEGGRAENVFAQPEVVTAETTYIINQVQHCSHEPRGAVVDWNNGQPRVYESTQGVVGVRDSVANHFKLDRNAVQAVCNYTGGGFGIKCNFTWDMTIPALELSRELGAPVLLFHNRMAELMSGGRDPHYVTIKLGARKDGTLAAEYRRGAWLPPTAWYRVPVRSRDELQGVNLHVSGGEGPLRAPGAPQAMFLMEGAMDVLAEKAGIDPLELRLKNVEGWRHNQMKQWFEVGSKKIGWERRQRPAGSSHGVVKRGIGVGVGEFAGSSGCHFVEAEVDIETGVIRVLRAVAVISGGFVNRLLAESQVIGGTIMGLSWWMFEDRLFDRQTGAFLSGNLETYKIAGPLDVPEIEVVLLGQEGNPGGLGECPVVPIGGAIANAVFNATGVPIRRLPFTPRNVLASLHNV